MKLDALGRRFQNWKPPHQLKKQSDSPAAKSRECDAVYDQVKPVRERPIGMQEIAQGISGDNQQEDNCNRRAKRRCGTAKRSAVNELM